MATAPKTYFLAPEFTFPSDGPLRLGVILPNPTRPEDALNIKSVVPIDKREVKSTTKANWQFLFKTIKPSRVFAQASSKLSHDSRKPRQLIHADEVITNYFNPSTEYIAKSMESANVVQYVHEKHFTASLYMITGVKIARNATVRSSNTDFQQTDSFTDVDALATGLPLKLEMLASLSSSADTKFAFKTSEFVFAYRVRKIVYSKRRGSFPLKPNTKGALFSTDADLWNLKEDEDYEDQLEQIDVLGLEKMDLDPDGVDVSSIRLLDDNTGEEVEFIIPS